jgi:excisionase family DNA binding protein
MPDEPERWRTAAEASEYLAISEATLQRWLSERNLPVHRVGRTLRFKLSEIDAWVRAGGAAERAPVAKKRRKGPSTP